MNGTDCGAIRDGFEMTSYEYSCCQNLAGRTSPGFDAEYAPRIDCFFHQYRKKGIPIPGPDMAELMSAEGEMEAKREAGKKRRRAAVDEMMRRAGYAPTQRELDECAKRAADPYGFLPR